MAKGAVSGGSLYREERYDEIVTLSVRHWGETGYHNAMRRGVLCCG